MTTKIGGLLGVVLAAAVLTACGNAGDTDSGSQPRATATDDAPGDGDRVVADDDTAITVVESALGSRGAKASWRGDTLRVELDGSVGSPTAFLYCSTLDAVLTEGQSGVFVYPDGEADCEDDPRHAD